MLKRLAFILAFLSSTALATVLGVQGGGTNASSASAARTNLGAAASGANSDITSLSGITTPLTVAEGGTNATTASAALTSLGATPTTRTISTTAPITGGGDLSTNRTLSMPQATASVDGWLGHSDWSLFNSKAASGANADITSLSKIGAAGVVFNDTEGSPKTVTLVSPATLNSNYTLTLPADPPTITSQPLCYGGATLAWCDPLTGFISGATFNTKTQSLAGTHPMVAAFCTAADGNQDVVAGGNAVCDGVDNSGGFGLSGGAVLLTAETDPTQNGLWDVNGFGAWQYDPSWGDQGGGCSGQSDGYILSVKAGGTTYGNTVWQVKCVAGNATFMQLGPVATRVGNCTVSSTTLSTTATNLTCTGVPASTHVSVRCSGQAAFSTATANGLYCRATGTANQIACNTIAANTTAMAYSCAWDQP